MGGGLSRAGNVASWGIAVGAVYWWMRNEKVPVQEFTDDEAKLWNAKVLEKEKIEKQLEEAQSGKKSRK